MMAATSMKNVQRKSAAAVAVVVVEVEAVVVEVEAVVIEVEDGETVDATFGKDVASEENDLCVRIEACFGDVR